MVLLQHQVNHVKLFVFIRLFFKIRILLAHISIYEFPILAFGGGAVFGSSFASAAPSSPVGSIFGGGGGSQNVGFGQLAQQSPNTGIFGGGGGGDTSIFGGGSFGGFATQQQPQQQQQQPSFQ